MPDQMERRYRAFLSYSHKDRRKCDKLFRGLENFAIDRHLIGTVTPVGVVPKSFHGQIFRDREFFGVGQPLTAETKAALASSDFLIVLCSPRAVASTNVCEEIRLFKAMRPAERVIPIIIDGDPSSAEHQCFPEPLRFKAGPGGTGSNEPENPLAADARKHGDGWDWTKVKVVSRLLGVSQEEIAKRYQRHLARRRKISAAAAAVLLVLLIGAIAGWILAWREGNAKLAALEANERLLGDTLAMTSKIAASSVEVSDAYAIPSTGVIEIVSSATEWLDRLGPDVPRSTDTQQHMLSTLVRFADIYRRHSSDGKQRQFIDQAGILAAALETRPAECARCYELLPEVYNQIGYSLYLSNEHEGAIEAFDKGLSIGTELYSEDQPIDEARLLQVRRELYLGKSTVLQKSADLKGALKVALLALDRARTAQQHDPTGVEVRQSLAASLMKVSGLREEIGDTASLALAAAEIAEGRSLIEGLLRERPRSLRLRKLLGWIMTVEGDLLSRRRDFEGALRAYRRNADVQASLLADDRTSQPVHSAYAYSHIKIGETLLEMGGAGQRRAALEAFERSIGEYERMIGAHPAMPATTYAPALRNILTAYDGYRHAIRANEVEPSARGPKLVNADRRRLRLARELFSSNSQNPASRVEVIKALRDLADSLVEAHKYQEAHFVYLQVRMEWHELDCTLPELASKHAHVMVWAKARIASLKGLAAMPSQRSALRKAETAEPVCPDVEEASNVPTGTIAPVLARVR